MSSNDHGKAMVRLAAIRAARNKVGVTARIVMAAVFAPIDIDSEVMGFESPTMKQ